MSPRLKTRNDCTFALVLATLSLAMVGLSGPASTSALAANAHRGVAPLLVPSSSARLHTSTNASIGFRFPKGSWSADSPLAGDGFFSRTTRLHGQHCTVSLTVRGTGKRLHPSLTTTPHSDNVQRGIDGDIHWLSAFSELSRTNPMPYARAYRPAPGWVKVQWATVTVTTQVSRIGAPAWCLRSMKRIDVGAIARSAHVGHGSARHI